MGLPDMEENSIFVVEDDAPVRNVLVEALQTTGYRAIGFADGASALASLAEGAPALILLDMRMPGMDGFEFLSRLRADPQWDGLPVVIVSGLGEDLLRAIDARAAEGLGVAGIFAKPFDMPTLLRYVGGIITRDTAFRSSSARAREPLNG